MYNRPNEIDELLQSITDQEFDQLVEILIIEDGSKNTSKNMVDGYKDKFTIHYFFKENTGPGGSRNFGMQQAKGDYFIILDSDVLLPKNYFNEVHSHLESNYTDAYGGPDAAHPDFTSLQKAINYSITSFLTTGGIRGKKNGVGKFQPRSFNMGLSRKAFEVTQGFSDMRVGEDIDLTFRLWEAGFETQLIDRAFVYHKRRNTLTSFYCQTLAFGTARPVLSKKYPSTKKVTYWFPSLFILGLDCAILLLIFGHWYFTAFYAVYFVALFLDASIKNNSVKVGFLSVITSFTQFIGYGLGFLQSQFSTK